MPATEITTDLNIVNAALTGLGMDPITSFADASVSANLAEATYDAILESVLSAHPWNFAMVHATLKMNVKDVDVWHYDYRYQLPTGALRIWDVEDQSANEDDEWTVSDDSLLSNLQGSLKSAAFGTAVAGPQLNIDAHGFAAGDAVQVYNGGNGLPSGLAEDTLYYVIVVDADNIQLETSISGGNVISATDGGADNSIQRRTIRCRYITKITDVTKYSPTFIQALIAKCQAEWTEALVKATNLGERMDEKYMDKLAMARTFDGQEGTPERMDTSTWIDSR